MLILRRWAPAGKPGKAQEQGRFIFRLRMTRAPPTSRSGTWPTHFRPLRWPLTTLLLPPATRHSPLFQAVSVRSIWGEPGRTANRQAFPNSPYPAISLSLQDRQIERISFRVSTNTHRAPLRGLSEARAFTSYRIGKDHPHDPDILSLRHDCPSLANVSVTWALLDGTSAIVVGSFCRNQPPQNFSSRRFSQASHAHALLLNPLLP